jgi:hypothetical protein
MDRRKFLTSLVGGVVAGAAVRTFPFRVFSFPKEIDTHPAIYGLIGYPKIVAAQLEAISSRLSVCEDVTFYERITMTDIYPISGRMFRMPLPKGMLLPSADGGILRICREITIEEAKREFPQAFYRS